MTVKSCSYNTRLYSTDTCSFMYNDYVVATVHIGTRVGHGGSDLVAICLGWLSAGNT